VKWDLFRERKQLAIVEYTKVKQKQRMVEYLVRLLTLVSCFKGLKARYSKYKKDKFYKVGVNILKYKLVIQFKNYLDRFMKIDKKQRNSLRFSFVMIK
jgi:hypothetical protein